MTTVAGTEPVWARTQSLILAFHMDAEDWAFGSCCTTFSSTSAGSWIESVAAYNKIVVCIGCQHHRQLLWPAGPLWKSQSIYCHYSACDRVWCMGWVVGKYNYWCCSKHSKRNPNTHWPAYWICIGLWVPSAAWWWQVRETPSSIKQVHSESSCEPPASQSTDRYITKRQQTIRGRRHTIWQP